MLRAERLSRRTHLLVLDILGLFSSLYMVARERMLGRKCPELQALAQRDEIAWQNVILRRLNELQSRRLEGMNPHKRPDFLYEDRFQVLQLIELAGWSDKVAARKLIVHVNTIRNWKREARGVNASRFLGKPPFNKMGEAVRWLVHEIRRICPDPSFGTCTIAMTIVRAGLQISRSTVQRVLREQRPRQPKQSSETAKSGDRASFNVLRPRSVNWTWHLDLTTFDFLFVRFYVAAILDGFSRRLIALHVYLDSPTTKDMLALVGSRTKACGAPRFLVTDGGSQFRSRFRKKIGRNGVKVITGRDSKRFNGKVERNFRLLKWWRKLTLLAPALLRIQPRLDVFRTWYCRERPMWVLAGRTPDETWHGEPPPRGVPIRAHHSQPEIVVRRSHFRGDPVLPKVEIEILRSTKLVA